MRAAIWFGLGATLIASCALAQATPATGDVRRSYRFEAAKAEMPYRLYVPATYDGGRPYPLVMVLHGGGQDENSVFDATDIEALAEARGMIVVAPLGYSRFGGYGVIYPVMMSKALGAAIAELRTRSGQAGAADPGGAPARPDKPAAPDDVMEVQASMMVEPEAGQLSEQDVLNVLARVRQEYRIDPARIYLMGNSMGGMGAAYLGAKYPETFAAIAPAGGPLAAWSYPFGRLRTHGVAALFVHGELDEHAHPRWSRALAEAARAEGVDADFLQVAGGSHARAWIMALPQMLDFFLAHPKTRGDGR